MENAIFEIKWQNYTRQKCMKKVVDKWFTIYNI